MERSKFSGEAGEQLAGILKKCLAPFTAFIFGYNEKEAHFYLVVFSEQSKYTGSALSNLIAQQSEHKFSATVLLHKVTDLCTTQTSQQHFFNHILKHAQRLKLDTANIPYLLNHNPQRDFETDTRYWHKCIAVAQFNIQCAKDNPQEEVTLCRIALLNMGCVQIALGLIRVFLGYSPNEFGLNCLLQLCGHFTDLTELVFDTQTPEALKRYKMLCAPPSMLYHWMRLDADKSDFELLLDQCQEFLDEAVRLAANELNRLQTLTPIL